MTYFYHILHINLKYVNITLNIYVHIAWLYNIYDEILINLESFNMKKDDAINQGWKIQESSVIFSVSHIFDSRNILYNFVVYICMHKNIFYLLNCS